jgi:hypothetical protein
MQIPHRTPLHIEIYEKYIYQSYEHWQIDVRNDKLQITMKIISHNIQPN